MQKRAASPRPHEFHMEIQGSLLQALGVNLYSSIAKCLVEFAANAYDSDATTFNISIPDQEILAARDQIRKKSKLRKKDQQLKNKPVVLLDNLPSHITIVMEDNGHGMLPHEIQAKFLPVNRNRRHNTRGEETPQSSRTESGQRLAMGRKGLGKLAAFGVAEEVTIYSKRKGETFATEFTMEYSKMRTSNRIHTVPFAAAYKENLPIKEHGTRITLRLLRCDSVSGGSSSIESSLRDNFFGIPEREFRILINKRTIEPEKVAYEYIFPEGTAQSHLAKRTITLPDDLGSFEIGIRAMFRESVEGKRVHLPSAKRGARIYCNGRLAAGPTLADLHSGVHNFVSTAYLEVVVNADPIDALGIDLINTNRTDFRRDNELVSTFLTDLTVFMQDALKGHSKFRDGKADKELKQSAIGKEIEEQISQLPSKTQAPTRKLVTLLSRLQGPTSDNFKQTAPLILDSVNTGNVLVKLLDMSTRETDLKEILRELNRLAKIEQTDALKLFRARKNGIQAIQRLIKRGEEAWKKNPNFEGDLHKLLKNNPWLLDESYGKYITSDKHLATTLQSLDKLLKIDSHAPKRDDKKKPGLEPTTRSDLVFLLGDNTSPSTIIVVELKSPNIPLSIDHWTQLEGYITEIELHMGTRTSESTKVLGVLIGTMPPSNSRSKDEQILIKKWRESLHGSQVQILTLQSLADHAAKSNLDQLRILEAEEEREG
jgi:hypothetical protein